MIILSGLISAFNTLGVVTPTSTNTYNLDQQQWHNITSNTSTITSQSAIDAKTEQYNNGASGVADFLMGTIYVKGILDSWAMNNWVIGLFTTVLQSALYFVAIIGSLAWVLNKLNVI
jgi:hypothetical protein